MRPKKKGGGGGGGGHNFATNFFSKCFSEMVGIVLVITYKWEASDPLQKIGFPRSKMTWKHYVKKWKHFVQKCKHLRIHGNFLETSEFCPIRFPIQGPLKPNFLQWIR